MRRRPPAAALAAAAGLMVLGGLALLVVSPPVTFGWFAYAPLSSGTFSGALRDVVVLSRQQAVGAGAAALGAALLAGTVGLALGRRASPSL